MKARLLLNDRCLGIVVLIKDNLDRYSLKFTLDRKVKSVDLYTNPDRTGAFFPEESLFSSRTIPKGATLELSYKFSNQKLEHKVEMKSGSIERLFYDVTLPALGPLFLVRVKNYTDLQRVADEPGDVNLSGGLTCEDFVISFSFDSENGESWTDILTQGETHTQTVIPMSGLEPNRLTIWTARDREPHGGNSTVSLWIPEVHSITKDTGPKR